MKRLVAFCLPALAVFFAACAEMRGPASPATPTVAPAAHASPTPGDVNREKAEEAALASALQNIQAKKADYKIGGADLLEVTVFQQPELSRALRVSQNGTVSFPLIGTVKVGGLTTTESEDAISGKLKEYVISPQVTIFVKEYGNKKVFVLGEVHKPGSYELPTEAKLTVLEAISLAGGFTPIAAQDRTKVIRNVGGQSQSHTVPISDITTRGQKEKDMTLEPNDVIYVPQSFF